MTLQTSLGLQSYASASASAAAQDPAHARIAAAAKEFEGQFLSVMIGQMFEGVGAASGPFSGGAGESAFKSFMTNAFGKALAAHGGIGLAKDVSHAMLKLQGLS